MNYSTDLNKVKAGWVKTEQQEIQNDLSLSNKKIKTKQQNRATKPYVLCTYVWVL